jgi:dTDP-4-dehydrorhamnose 3,5-epimerase
MDVSNGRLEGIRIFTPRVFRDDRGWFKETLQQARYAAHGIPVLVQENLSSSRRGVIRGLHFQVDPHAQGKLVQVLRGAAWDVVIDIRPGSRTFGEWESFELSAERHAQLWIPAGFAHGFQALEDDTLLHYACSEAYAPAAERAFHAFSPELALPWPLRDVAVMNEKDRVAPSFTRAGSP